MTATIRTALRHLAAFVAILLLANALTGCPIGIVGGGKTVDFTGSPAYGRGQLTVQFTNKSDPQAGYYWEFGDGAVSYYESPAHTYTNPGIYNVTLRLIVDGAFAESKTKLEYVIVTSDSFAIAAGSSGDEESRTLVESYRNGFAMAGHHLSSKPSTQYYDGFCTDVDAFGKPYWSLGYTSGAGGNTWFNDMIQVQNTGNAQYREAYLLVGTAGVPPDTAMYLALTYAGGGKELASLSADQDTGSDEGFGACLSGTGDLICAGDSQSSASSTNGILIGGYALADNQQQTFWQRTFTDAHTDAYVAGIVPVIGGGYLIGVTTRPAAGGTTGAMLVWTQPDGSYRNAIAYGQSGVNQGINALVRTPDGGYAFAGYVDTAAAKREMWLVTVDSNGNVKDDVTLGEAETCEEAFGLDLSHDGGAFILAGRSGGSAANLDASYGYIVKTTADLTVAWKRRIDNLGYNMFYDVVRVEDGCYAAAGWIQTAAGQYGNGGKDMYLLKLSPSGLGNASPTTYPLSAP